MSKKVLQKSLKKNKPFIVPHWHATLNDYFKAIGLIYKNIYSKAKTFA
jgi:hypothetical protein